jgi:hypothetical protein
VFVYPGAQVRATRRACLDIASNWFKSPLTAWASTPEEVNSFNSARVARSLPPRFWRAILAAMSIWIGVVTTVVAICVAWISFLQWKTNAQKLRLDLYEKRFQIYLRVLAFYQQIVVWEDREDQIASQQPFFTAFRESRFMFPPKSQVYELLKEFHQRAFFVVKFTETREKLRGMPQETMELANKRIEHVNWLLRSIDDIEKGMTPYLKFHNV